jgi:transposase
MTLDRETEAEVLRLFYAEKWRAGTIATQLGIHGSTVRRVLTNNGVSNELLRIRPSKVDPYLPFIRSTLEKYPKLTAVRLFEMVNQRGFTGSPSHFRHMVGRHRPRPAAEPFMRTSTLPGEQAQCDWAHFGKVEIGGTQRRLLAFVMVMSWSRHVFLRFYVGDAMPNFLRGHVDAFSFFGAVPREILYDNLKSAVLERVGSAIRFNPQLLALAGYYRFGPVPVAVAKGNQKGRVERAIRYIRSSFFAAREWADLADLNNQATSWSMNTAGSRRCREQEELTVLQAFEKEKPALIVLPDNPYPAAERKEVKVGKTPYVRFDLNDYSVPHRFVRRSLTVLATPETVKILNGIEEVACHARNFGKGCQTEEAKHVEELANFKEAGRKHRAIDQLRHAAPAAKRLLKEAAERGHGLGRLTQQLTHLLNLYGPVELDAAINLALEADSPHAAAVEQVLEKRRSDRNLPPPVVLQFSVHEQINRMTVVPRSLDIYDSLLRQSEKNNDEGT